MSITKIIFLDLGGILFYDEYVELFFLNQIFTSLNKCLLEQISIDTFFQHREILYKEYGNNWINIFLLERLPNEICDEIIHQSWRKTLENFTTLFKPYPDSKDLLEKLYHISDLYCFANQPLEAKEVIENLGYLKFFKEVFIDTIEGFSKPDIRFFQKALVRAQLAPEEVIYVGDRLDNDILPALSIGIKCIKLTQPLELMYIENITYNFTTRFYQSLNKVWHRWEKLENQDYLNISSYELLLTSIAFI